MYRFETPEGSLLFQDTCGHWTGVLRELQSDVAILAAAGRGNVDGEPVQGSLAQFVAHEVDLLRPRRVILGHHDDWLPGVSIATDTAPLRAALAAAAPDTELVEMGYCAAYPVFAGLAAQPTDDHRPTARPERRRVAPDPARARCSRPERFRRGRSPPTSR